MVAKNMYTMTNDELAALHICGRLFFACNNSKYSDISGGVILNFIHTIQKKYIILIDKLL